MTEKANLVDIFRNLKSRRLRLLKLIGQERAEHNIRVIPSHADDLSVVLNELKTNEEHLIELSDELLRNTRFRNTKFREFVRSSLSEIKSSLHWLDVLIAHYRNTRALI